MAILTEYLTNIANAIRTKKGTTDPINAQDFATEITNLPTGSTSTLLKSIVEGTLTEMRAEDWEGIDSIGAAVFCYNESLTSLVIPDRFTSIPGYFAWECDNLATITLSKNLTEIPAGAFGRNGSLRSIDIPEGVTDIDEQAFYGNIHLTSVTIPSTVTTIGESAFQLAGLSPSYMTTFTIKATTPPTIGASTFTAGRINKIIVPYGCKATYIAATNWSSLADLIEEAENSSTGGDSGSGGSGSTETDYSSYLKLALLPVSDGDGFELAAPAEGDYEAVFVDEDGTISLEGTVHLTTDLQNFDFSSDSGDFTLVAGTTHYLYINIDTLYSATRHLDVADYYEEGAPMIITSECNRYDGVLTSSGTEMGVFNRP